MTAVAQGGGLAGVAVHNTARRRNGLWALLACVPMWAPAGPGSAATRAGVDPSAPATLAPSGLTVQVTLALSGLHPAVTQAGLDCGAIAQSAAWVEARRSTLVDYDSTNQIVLRPAHYLGQESLVSFPVVARQFSGSTSIRLRLAPQGLSDPTTHRPWTPTPAVLVACWLLLNGHPATWDRGSSAQVVAAANFSGVRPNPIIVVVADATGAGPWAATGRLSAQGQYFVPAPVYVAETVQTYGAAGAPVADGAGATDAAANALRAPIAPAASGSSAGGRGGIRVPAPITLTSALAASRSARFPLNLNLTGGLSASGAMLLPVPISLGAVLSVAGGVRLPTPIALSAALTATGSRRVPAPLTLNAALSASGAAGAALLPRTPPSALLPK